VFFEVLTDEVSKSLQEILSSLNYSLYHLNIENSKPNAVKVDVLICKPARSLELFSHPFRR
jgi:hypothetical protein